MADRYNMARRANIDDRYGMGRRLGRDRSLERQARYDREDREDRDRYSREDREREARSQRECHRLMDEGADLRRQQNEIALEIEQGDRAERPDQGHQERRFLALEQDIANLQLSIERLTAVVLQLMRAMGQGPGQAAEAIEKGGEA